MILDSLNLIEGSINNNLVFTSVTEAQKTALTNLEVGEVVYQTDGEIGLYQYTGSVWKFIGIPSADLAKKADLDNGRLSTSQIPQFSGDVTNTGNDISLVNSGVAADTYNKVTVNAKGIVTSATKETTLDGIGITDAVNKSLLPTTGDATSAQIVLGNDSRLTDTRTPKAHTHVVADITDLQTALDAKATPGDITTAITNIKASVPTDGDSLNKLYDLIISGFKEITVADIAARNAYDVKTLPTNIFVTDDTDGNWALYKATTTGTNATFVKLSDPDLLNSAVGFSPENISNKSTDGTFADNSDTKYPSQKAAKTYADTKVSKNADITAGTGTKVTYDVKGLVTGSTTLADTDIPSLAISKITDLQTTLDAKLAKNADITAGTGTKVTYDVKGLVTGSTSLVEADIPSLAISKVTNLQSSLDAKLAKNTAITAGTGTKVTYDVNGLVTSSTTLGTSDLPSNLVYTTAGKIASNLLPSMVVTNTTVVSDVAADETNIDTYVTGAIKGDIAILSNISKTFILSSVSPNVWVELLSPTGGVIAVNGLTGSSVDLAYDNIDAKSTDIVTSGTYNNVTVNAKGRITSVANTSYATLDSNNKIYATNLPTFIGDVTLDTTDNTLSLASVSNVAGTYNTATTVTPLTIDGKGRISTVGSATKITPAFADITSKPTTLSGYGITDAELSANKNIANGYAGLDSSIKLSTTILPSSVVLTNATTGLIDSSLLPAITMNNTFVVSNAAATASNIDTYATGAVKGDIAILTTLSKTFILSSVSPNVWSELLSPTGGVTSINGKTGSTVVLSYADIDGQSTDIVTAGTYNKVTVNAKGRVTAVANATYATLDSNSLLPVANLPALSGDVTTVTGSNGNVTKVAKINGITINNATSAAQDMILSLDSGLTSATWKAMSGATLDANNRLPAANLPLFTGGDITTTTSTAVLKVSKLNSIPLDMTYDTTYKPNANNALVFDATTSKLTYKGVALTGANTFTGTQEATTFKSNVSTGTAPLSVNSSTLVPYLNVNVVNGVTISGTAAAGSHIVASSATAAAWTAAPSFSTINTVTNRIADGDGDLRSIPTISKTAAYTLVASDNGKNINITTGGITIPQNLFLQGSAISIYNQSGTAQNISWSGPTVYASGSSTAKTSPLSLAARGIVTIFFATASEIVVSGNI